MVVPSTALVVDAAVLVVDGSDPAVVASPSLPDGLPLPPTESIGFSSRGAPPQARSTSVDASIERPSEHVIDDRVPRAQPSRAEEPVQTPVRSRNRRLRRSRSH